MCGTSDFSSGRYGGWLKKLTRDGKNYLRYFEFFLIFFKPHNISNHLFKILNV
jgi:hypothetical protein